MAIVEINHLCKAYGEKRIFQNFSLRIKEREMVAITGESGCGKSTLLNIIGMLETFDSGTVTVCNNTNVRPNSSAAVRILRNTVSYLFQNFALVEDEKVSDNLLMAMKYIKESKAVKRKKIIETLLSVGLAGQENKKVFQLSGGEQQRVAIARLLLKPCQIVLADEPTGSVDPKNRESILDMLKLMNKNGKTIIIVTHDPYVAENCDRVIQL